MARWMPRFKAVRALHPNMARLQTLSRSIAVDEGNRWATGHRRVRLEEDGNDRTGQSAEPILSSPLPAAFM